MIQVKKSLINEPYLVHGRSVKINISSGSKQTEIINSFSSIYDQAVGKLKKYSIKKIEIEFSTKWHILSRVVYDHDFHRSLTRWKLDPQAAKPSRIAYNISSKKPHFTDLFLLLHQQADYHYNLYPNYYKNSDTTNWTDYAKYYQKDLDNPKSVYFTFVSEDKVIGLCLGEIDKKIAHIWELIVDQNCRKAGIGSQLISSFINLCQEKKVEKIEVETGWNQTASRFYKKHLFTPIAQTWYRNY